MSHSKAQSVEILQSLILLILLKKHSSVKRNHQKRQNVSMNSKYMLVTAGLKDPGLVSHIVFIK